MAMSVIALMGVQGVNARRRQFLAIIVTSPVVNTDIVVVVVGSTAADAVVVVVVRSGTGAGWRDLVASSTRARDHVAGRTRASTAVLSKSVEGREAVDVRGCCGEVNV